MISNLSGIKLKKVVRDGKVAVLISPDHGAGWYTWHHVEELLYDPVIVSMVEANLDSYDIAEISEEMYGKDHYYDGAKGLEIQWVPVGTEFLVMEYDGAEFLYFKDKIEWLKA